jgi:hypothetical protein
MKNTINTNNSRNGKVSYAKITITIDIFYYCNFYIYDIAEDGYLAETCSVVCLQ